MAKSNGGGASGSGGRGGYRTQYTATDKLRSALSGYQSALSSGTLNPKIARSAISDIKRELRYRDKTPNFRLGE